MKHPNFAEIKHRGELFVVKHYAGPVAYTSEGFVAKNKDQLPHDISNLLQSSTESYILDLFSSILNGALNTKIGGANIGGDEYFTAFGSGFIGTQYYISWTANN